MKLRRMMPLWLALAVALMFASALPAVVGAEEVGTQETAAWAAGSLRFSCAVGRYGADPCGPYVSVPAGGYIGVTLDSNVAKYIEFCTQGSCIFLQPGGSGIVWYNQSTLPVSVQLTADADGLVNTSVTGTIYWGP